MRKSFFPSLDVFLIWSFGIILILIFWRTTRCKHLTRFWLWLKGSAPLGLAVFEQSPARY